MRATGTVPTAQWKIGDASSGRVVFVDFLAKNVWLCIILTKSCRGTIDGAINANGYADMWIQHEFQLRVVQILFHLLSISIIFRKTRIFFIIYFCTALI